MLWKKLTLAVASLLIALALVVPSYAGKKAISESELDAFTAAGEPKVVVADGPGNVAATINDRTTMAQHIGDTAQQDLRALVLNNIVGENQIANGINIASGGGSGQTNNIVQSWGAVLDLGVDRGTNVPGTPGGAATCNAEALICKPKGGNAAPGAVATPVRLSIYADQIASASSPDGAAAASIHEFHAFAQDLQDNAQTNLAALIVNNVVGYNQVANGVNIAGAADIVKGVTIGGAATSGGQTNTINQFRGAPFGWNTRGTN